MIKQKTSFAQKIMAKGSDWFLKNRASKRAYLCNFPQICENILSGDVLLIEGRSRISEMIQVITQSPWSHAMLYIGRLHEIEDLKLQAAIQQKFSIQSETQLLIESELGYGTIVSPLEKYANDHIRILRPNGLSILDAQKIISYALERIGTHYGIRHILELGQFLLPWHLFPAQWRTYFFERCVKTQPMEDICSSMIAQAFQSIQFPILPEITRNEIKAIQLTERPAHLFTPSDFDFSPYFSVIRNPLFEVGKNGYYHHLPWKDKIKR